jgi:hypothetical protein
VRATVLKARAIKRGEAIMRIGIDGGIEQITDTLKSAFLGRRYSLTYCWTQVA